MGIFSPVLKFSQQEPAVQHDTDGIPDDERRQSLDNAVHQPDNNSRQQQGIEEQAYLTGAFYL
jgi:hypothetical protein